ncbi:MAG TPA: helix-turn-helix transcriptional regulator [Caulobacteraceae bacterium]|nr:helix-turn-helix transcriptional regulator [Caulobacteraceae bacterium]
MPTTPRTGGDLAGFLRDRRARLPPPPGASRRRTPGLRREEVAARAGVSVTWYTWLEQARGGPPSAEALERIASALELDDQGRELLFLLAQQRPPPLRPTAAAEVPAAVQAVMDAMTLSPAFVKTAAWDVVAANAAAEVVFGGRLDASTPRNGLKQLFLDPTMRESMPEWEAHARFAVSVFRVDLARAAGDAQAQAVLAELHASSGDFRRLWAENEVAGHRAGLKRLRHTVAGVITMHTAAFRIDGAEGLTMIVYTPASAADAQAIASLLEGLAKAA